MIECLWKLKQGEAMEAISVSESNIKMGAVPSVSLVPILDCPEGCLCAPKCYARRLCGRRKSVLKAWERNSRIIRADLDSFMRQLSGWLLWRSPKFFRWHVGGDFLSMEHLKGAFKLAKENPDTLFLAFTKRYDLLDNVSKTPDNFVLTLSAWNGMDFDTKLAKRFPVAWCYDEKNIDSRIPKKSFKCQGDCASCKVCFMAKEAEIRNVTFDIH
jgi:hypothetical protein